jgi:hypothetical protein
MVEIDISVISYILNSFDIQLAKDMKNIKSTIQNGKIFIYCICGSILSEDSKLLHIKFSNISQNQVILLNSKCGILWFETFMIFQLCKKCERKYLCNSCGKNIISDYNLCKFCISKFIVDNNLTKNLKKLVMDPTVPWIRKYCEFLDIYNYKDLYCNCGKNIQSYREIYYRDLSQYSYNKNKMFMVKAELKDGGFHLVSTICDSCRNNNIKICMCGMRHLTGKKLCVKCWKYYHIMAETRSNPNNIIKALIKYKLIINKEEIRKWYYSGACGVSTTFSLYNDEYRNWKYARLKYEDTSLIKHEDSCICGNSITQHHYISTPYDNSIFERADPKSNITIIKRKFDGMYDMLIVVEKECCKYFQNLCPRCGSLHDNYHIDLCDKCINIVKECNIDNYNNQEGFYKQYFIE